MHQTTQNVLVYSIIVCLFIGCGGVLYDIASEGAKTVAAKSVAPYVAQQKETALITELRKELKEKEKELKLEKQRGDGLKLRLRQESINTDKLRMMLLKSVSYKEKEVPKKKESDGL